LAGPAAPRAVAGSLDTAAGPVGRAHAGVLTVSDDRIVRARQGSYLPPRQPPRSWTSPLPP